MPLPALRRLYSGVWLWLGLRCHKVQQRVSGYLKTIFTGIYPLDQILPVRFQFSQALEVVVVVA